LSTAKLATDRIAGFIQSTEKESGGHRNVGEQRVDGMAFDAERMGNRMTLAVHARRDIGRSERTDGNGTNFLVLPGHFD